MIFVFAAQTWDNSILKKLVDIDMSLIIPAFLILLSSDACTYNL